MRMKQLTLYNAMPGYRGGCALRDKLGVEYLRRIGYNGGVATRERYGAAHYRRIALLGVEARRKARENDPRTVKFWDGTTRRIVPYKKASSRAKRPIMVQVLLDEV